MYQVGSVVGLASCTLPTWLGDDYDDDHNGSTCTGCINNLDSSTQF